MKLINKLWLMALTVFAVTACEKVADLPMYNNGVASVLSTSAAVVAPPPADSLKPVVTFSWTDPKYATDSSKVKYILEIDSTGRNFSKAVTRVVNGSKSRTFTAKELNDILLGFGFKFGQAYDLDVRIISSYANNNERIVGNTVKLKATPYKVPPKVALPANGRLFITGDATDFDWTNPVSMRPERELTRLDETKWAGIFRLNGGGNYILLTQPGNWNLKYAIADRSIAGVANGGTFGFNLSEDIPGNVTGGSGWYKLLFDFQEGTYSLTKMENALPPMLYVTGDATADNWTNTPSAAQRFIMISNGLYEIDIPLTTGKAYKFLGLHGNWVPQFGGNSATGGTLGANYGGPNDPAAVPAPAISGTYKIQVNFHTEKYTVTKL